MAPTSRIASSAGRPDSASAALEEMCRGHMLADVVAVIGSQDIVFGEIGPVSSERSNVGIGGTALASKLQLLSQETRGEIDRWVAKFPPGRQRSASLAALRAAQEQNHRLPHRGPHGRGGGVPGSAAGPGVRGRELLFDVRDPSLRAHHVSICNQHLLHAERAEELAAHAQRKLGIKLNHSTPDGRIFLKQEEECLAACTAHP